MMTTKHKIINGDSCQMSELKDLKKIQYATFLYIFASNI